MPLKWLLERGAVLGLVLTEQPYKAICGAGAAIINAIYDATRIRARDLPASLDKVLPGFDQLE